MKYSLYPNKLTEADDYTARPVSIKRNTREDLIRDITGPGSILKPTETNASINNYWETIASYIEQGEDYRDEYITISFNMGGVYLTIDDRFDRDRHSLVTGIIPGELLRNAVDKVQPEYVKAEDGGPQIDSVYDWLSDTLSEQVTPGSVMEIKGEDLKIYDNDEGEGVYFVSQSTDSEVKAERIRTNEPKTLTLIVPNLDMGDYQLEVRNTHRQGKTLRVGIFTTKLSYINEPEH